MTIYALDPMRYTSYEFLLYAIEPLWSTTKINAVDTLRPKCIYTIADPLGRAAWVYAVAIP